MGSQDSKRRRRIALVTHGLGGGGVSTVAMWLRDGLQSTGDYIVDIHDLATSRRDSSSRRLASPSTWTRASLRASRSETDTDHHWGANAVEIETMRYRPRPELLAEMNGYDLVQIVSGSPAWAAPVLGCGRPVVLQVATLVAWERRRQLPRRSLVDSWRRSMTTLTARIEATALRRVDAVLVENDAMLSHVRGTGQPRVTKAPPGVDTLAFSPAKPGWDRTSYLLSVCRLGDPRKGLDLLVRAYGHLVREDETTPGLILAGQGRISDDVARLIVELGLSDRVIVRSDVPQSELAGIYQRASVFIQTSHEEGLGMSMLEAMACGLPVVSTATNGAKEAVVDGRTGWLVDLTTADVPHAVAERVRGALSGAGRDAGAQGRDRCVAVFSTDVCLQRFVTVHNDLLHASNVPAI